MRFGAGALKLYRIAAEVRFTDLNRLLLQPYIIPCTKTPYNLKISDTFEPWNLGTGFRSCLCNWVLPGSDNVPLDLQKITQIG